MFIFRLRNLAIFYRELASMLNSGMDIIGALDILSEHIGISELKFAIARIKQCLLKGETLSSALAKFPQFFPQWQINVVKYSEMGGKLGAGLSSIGDYLEKDYEIQKELIVGLAYPCLLFHVAIVLFPLAKLITGHPFAYLWDVLRVLLPVYLSLFLIYMARRLFSSALFKSMYDGIILNIPVFGGLLERLSLARFIRSLKCLSDSGVSIIQSWRTAASLCGNARISNSLLKALPLIERGEGINLAFKQTGVFPARIIGMIVTAEKSGNINEILGKIALYYEKDNELLTGVLVRTMPIVIYLMIGGYIMYRILSFYTGYLSQFSNILDQARGR